MAKNILICDDAAFMRMMIKNVLTKGGYNVAGEAENGAKAVEKYSMMEPGAKSRISEIDLLVRPSSTVTFRGTSMMRPMFSCPAMALPSLEKLWNCMGMNPQMMGMGGMQMGMNPQMMNMGMPGGAAMNQRQRPETARQQALPPSSPQPVTGSS